MPEDLICQGKFLDQAQGQEVADGWDIDYDTAVTKGTTNAKTKVDDKVAEALKGLACPHPCETWHKVRTERIIGRHVIDPRSQVIEVAITLKWHLDILCHDPKAIWPGPAAGQPAEHKGKLF